MTALNRTLCEVSVDVELERQTLVLRKQEPIASATRITGPCGYDRGKFSQNRVR